MIQSMVWQHIFIQKKLKDLGIVENLEYGMIGINSGKISTYLNPFGGLRNLE